MQTRPNLVHALLRRGRKVRLREGDDLIIDVEDQVGGMEEVVAEDEAVGRRRHAEGTAVRRTAFFVGGGIVGFDEGAGWSDDCGARGAAESEREAGGGGGEIARGVVLPVAASFRLEGLLESGKQVGW